MRRYNNLGLIVSDEEKVYRSNPIYPSTPPSPEDFYVITSVGDRYDTLAQTFYGDSSLWWIISSANNYSRGSLVVQPGVQLRIPANKAKAIELFNNINATR